jgi:acetolactate synthase small subunit
VLVELDRPANDEARRALDDVLALAGGEILSDEPDLLRARLTGPPQTIDGALERLGAHGLRSLVRAGAVAMAAPTSTPDSENGATRS